MSGLNDIRETFFQECDELLVALEEGLNSMAGGSAEAETVNAVFRAVHTIKGGAGAFKLAALVAFAHRFESVLEAIRSGRIGADAEVTRILLHAADALADLVQDSRDGIEGAGVPIAQELDALLALDGSAADGGAFESFDFAPIMIAIEPPPGDQAPPPARFTLTFKPKAALYAKANDPIALFRELRRLGRLTLTCDVSALPPLARMDPMESYLSWSGTLETASSLSGILEVFDFVDGDCELTVAAEREAQPGIAQASETSIAATSIPDARPDKADAQRPAAAAQQTIRVDLERVDKLINLVGELVINQAMLTQRLTSDNKETLGSLEDLDRLTRDIQASVMAIRAQQVKSLFQRMSRIVREAVEATGKSARLKTEGENTEIDKTVIELLADPLTHMIRNAVDHGLEPPDLRAAAGKPPEGTIQLSALHRSGRVVISVSDDGAGIDRENVLATAIRKGLVPEGAVLPDAEIDNLLFLPGFSTAQSVSSLSGRGVGMDVVKRSIQALGGRIAISSTPKVGSTFTLSLPLTLAVLDGIVVSVAGQTFVIPLTAVVEALQLAPGVALPMGPGGHVIRVRGNFVPVADIGGELKLRGRKTKIDEGIVVLVENESHQRSALLVDSIQDQRQVVIKSLETNYGRVPGIAAATVLGDGRVALILDVDGIINQQRAEQRAQEPKLMLAS